MLLTQGQAFGRYTIDGLLGEGAMGRVYRATDGTLLRRVALKVLSRESRESRDSSAPDDAARVLREARAAAAINHENAITIFDVGEVDGTPYIAMEYVSGRVLREYVGESSISMEQRIDWLVAIARALAAAHERGLVHRDVKPENVLVRDDGLVKVLDFGIARPETVSVTVDGATLPAALVATGRAPDLAGTPAYMAPEQLRAEESGGRADQFAWGIVAYELLTGKHPFPFDELARLISAILGQTPAAPRSLSPEIPENVDAVIVRALSKSPAARFDSMFDVIKAITGRDASARSLGPPQASNRPAASDPKAIPAIGTLSAGVTAGAVPPVRRRRAPLAIAVALAAGVAAIGVAFTTTRHESRSTTSAQTNDAGTTSDAVPVTSLPIPTSSRLDAVAAYRAGLQAARDGSGSTARSSFAHAAELDPTMAGAHLWVASLSVFQNRKQAQAALAAARELRASLTSRDLVILAALEPLLAREPADLGAAERSLVEGIPAFSGDAHLRLFLAIVRAARAERSALTATSEALRLDPDYHAARLVRALALESFGEEEQALATYEECIARNPLATSCLAGKTKLLSRTGRCEELAADAKRWTTALPSDPEGHRQRAILASVRPGGDKVVAELLETSRTGLPPSDRLRRELVDRVELALLGGDMKKARDASQELVSTGSAHGGIGDRADAILALVEIADELGENTEAARIAKDYVDREELWSETARLDQDPTPVLVARARRAKLVGPDAAKRQRDQWLERWASRGRPGERWLVAFAAATATKEEAEEALAELPRFAPLPSFPDVRLSSALGRVYLLAGRLDDAITMLSRAASDCGVLRAPMAHVHSLVLLGEAASARGDNAKACEAYNRVVERWGGLGKDTDSFKRALAGKRATCPSAR